MKLLRAEFRDAIDVNGEMKHNVDAERHGFAMELETLQGVAYIRNGNVRRPMSTVLCWESYPETSKGK